MKAYTSLEQSKKLTKILPPESADMSYVYDRHLDKLYGDTPYFIGYKVLNENVDIPCWSLAALFGVLPTTIGNFFEKNALRLRMDKGENDFNIWYENFDCGDVAEGLDVREGNPTDACYEMLLKLYERKML